MIFLYILLSIPLISFLLVGVGLFFKKDMGKRTFDNGETIDCYELPDWLKWCQNTEDLLMGDHPRGWYWFTYMAGRPAWWKMLVWSAWRNPFNYLKRFVIGIDVRNYIFTKVVGQDYVRDDFASTGFQILKATPISGKGFSKYSLYWVYRYGTSDRALVMQLGWKIRLSHNSVVEEDEWDYWKGFTFEVNPYKDIA